MKEFTLNENQSGYQLRQVLHKILSEAPTSFIYKMLRKKNITLNGKKAEGTETTQAGDVIRFFLADETFDKFSKNGGARVNSTPCKDSANGGKTSVTGGKVTSTHDRLSSVLGKSTSAFGSSATSCEVIYQDEDVLIFVKPQGLLSQKVENSDVSANDFVLSYAKEHEIWNPEDPIFRPSIVNRLDRNTEGIMVAGLSSKGLRVLNEMFKDRTVSKFYRAIVVGKAPENGHLTGYLLKNEAKNTVSIIKEPVKNADRIETAFERLTFDEAKNLSLLKVHLITGKSHQIRAHLSSVGLPILGDTKYGTRDANEKFHMRMQCLQSYLLTVPKCDLESISEKTFTISAPKKWPVLGENE